MHSEKYIKIRRGSWQLLVRRGWEETDLLRLLGEEGPDGEVEAVRSSHFTRVGRLIVERDGEKVELYRKEYLARSCWEAVKSLVRPGRAQRAFEAGLMLEEHGLGTPEAVMLALKTVGPVCVKDVLITRAAEGLPLCPCWREALRGDGADVRRRRRQAARALGRTIGRMHAAGIFHGDLRGGNLLASEGPEGWRFWLIDNERTGRLGPLGRLGRLGRRRRRIKNLVQLNMLVQGPTTTDRLRFWKTYSEAAGFGDDRRLVAAILRRTRQRLLKRIRTHTEDYLEVRQGTRRGLLAKGLGTQEEAEAFVEQIETRMRDGKVLKDDLSTRVVRCEAWGRAVVIKRYNHQGLWHTLRHTIKGSRAAKCWRYGHLLEALGIACAPTLAVIEERRGALLWQSYIVNGFVEGPLLYDVMNKPGHSAEEQRTIMERAAALLRRLGTYGLTHGDMKPANLLICKGRPVLIDLDSMQQHRFEPWLAYRYRKMVRYFYRRLHGRSRSNRGRPATEADRITSCR